MSTLLTLLIAAVPLKWTVETTKVQPAQFDVVHGESIALEATLQSGGKPLDLTGSAAYLYWQTNGMDQTWWVGTATVNSNRLSAVFLPEMDPGASAVTGYIGVPGEIYRAAFQLRFRHGPGAIPNEIEPPVRTIDFNRVVVANAPWATPGDVADEATARANADAALGNAIASKADKSDISSLSNRVEQLTGGAITADDVRDIVTPKLNLKADAESPNIVGELSYGDGMAVTYEIAYSNGVMSTFSGWFGRTVGEKSDAFTENLQAVITNGVSIQSIHFANGNFYAVDIYRIYATDNIQINASGASGVVASKTYSIYPSSGLSVLESIERHAVPVTRKVNGQPLTSDINIEGMSANVIELKSGVLKTHDNATTITASHIGAADASTVDALGQQVGAIGLHLTAEDARAVITNYDSAVHMPEASLQVKVEGDWLMVWKEMTRWNWFLRDIFDPFTNQVYQALATKGEKEWGWFNSATGDASPDGLLQLAQPRIQICSGAAYQRYGDAAGAYWVLESNGLVANINGTTNGFFRVLDEDGNAQFAIIKGDKQTVFATAKTMRQEIMGVTHYYTEYAITNAVSSPVAEFTRSLEPDEIEWIAETSSSCPFNVSWTDKGNNTWEIEWWPKGTEPSAYMKCGYERGGETYIKNSAPVSMEYIILNGIKYRLGTATFSGNTVLTLTRITL